jgi:hypothetical protein
MSRLTLAAALALVMSASITRATSPNPQDGIAVYNSGEALTNHCRSYMTLVRNQMRGTNQIGLDAGQCYGFVVGVLDTMTFEGVRSFPSLPRFCLPRELNANAATEVVANYADQNPQVRGETAYQIIRRALAAAYPCR